MREIKFRAWDKQNKEFISNASLLSLMNGNKPKDIEVSGINDINNDALYIGDDIELMQYTGLKDKHGKEIYEGDILRVILEKSSAIGEVKYDERTFECINDSFDMEDPQSVICDILDYRTDLIEVIGNIYETPELLEGKS